MIWSLFGKKKSGDLAERCKAYLEKGPPSHMTDYVPESLTEIIIAHGSNSAPLDDELREIGSIILMETDGLDDIDDPEIRQYMHDGARLVQEVLES